ncbi:M13 family metallopeptidase [Arthrobacter tumbae]|uniref:M13 family metallopeptidase n=1 Tax=Arthrobacter tumbae TaxID=163874 RepID=UPI001956F190|nr:M13-type metalloendopeptidase [Arthrobacter tumbae]MBM7783168.1 putative endopeptidase [Arthrobacter tumbae]
MTASGINVANVDPDVRPQDDLFRHVNGGWLRNTPIPEDRAREGSFSQLADAAELAVRRIVEDTAADTDDDGDRFRIGVLFADFMDTDHLNAAGAAPVQPMLESIDAAAAVTDVVRLDAELTRAGAAGIVLPYVSNDAGNPERYLLHLYQSGLGLPDESYYREAKFEGARLGYVELLHQLFELAGRPESRAAAAGVFDLEARLAASHMDTVTRRNPQATYNLRTTAELIRDAPLLETWLTGLTSGVGIPGELIINQPGYVDALAGALEEVPLDVWKNWLGARVLLHAAPFLSDEFVGAHFTFYGTTLSGTPQLRERWKRGVAVVEGTMGEAVGREYVARHFPESHKATMLELVENVLAAYEQRINGLEWMSSRTRARALEKLSLFTTKIGYPDRWIDYSKLQVIPGDLYGNVRRATEFETDRQLAKLDGPIDRGEWHLTPQTVNAYYMPTMNEIVFPAAILQPPFFDADADPAANYGAIGAVIGHEIGHGFDDQGSQFDGTGALHNWWSEADRTAFEALTGRLVSQYAELAPTEAADHPVNGKLTLGENIGDLGGLGISLAAYVISLDGAEAPVLDGLTGFQRFFYSWAECWRQNIRPEEAARRIAIDPHSPNEFRCNQVVRNLDEFHDAFSVNQKDALWLAPEERVRIW